MRVIISISASSSANEMAGNISVPIEITRTNAIDRGNGIPKITEAMKGNT